jgi:hypothetical protein
MIKILKRLFVEMRRVRMMMMKNESTRIKREKAEKRARIKKLSEDTLT